MPSADWFDNNCFPNPFFSPHDVAIEHQKITIDLSRGSSSPVSSNLDEDSDDDDDMPPLVTPDPSEDGDSGDEAGDRDRTTAHYAVAPYLPGPDLPYTVSNVFSQVFRLFNDDLVAANFRAMFGGSEPGFEYPAIEHWYARLEDDTYALRPHMALLAMTHLRNLAGLISAALNAETVDLRGFEPGASKVSVAYDALAECHIVFPSILLLLSGRWDIRLRMYATEEGVRKLIEDILYVLRYGGAVVGKITVNALWLLEHSACNPGAGIGMEQEEFLERVRVQPHVTRGIERWLEPLLHGGSSIRAADTACGRLLCPQGFSEFVIFEDNAGSSIVPLHHEGHEGMTSRSYIRVEELPELLFARGFGH
ncbi:hypothetical protein K438DRAFT_1780232 [Mycena galopus ATCC 62051]|nr:hypothetical protein K438DRAFT_1780232 [Mycena galopus ATCC 62051]